MLEAGGRSQQPGDLVRTQHRWKLAGIGYADQLAGQIRPIERRGEEEPQRRDMAVHRRRGHPRLTLLDLKPANILGRGVIRRASEESGETLDDADDSRAGSSRRKPRTFISSIIRWRRPASGSEIGLFMDGSSQLKGAILVTSRTDALRGKLNAGQYRQPQSRHFPRSGFVLPRAIAPKEVAALC